jgi:hypothetical protein
MDMLLGRSPSLAAVAATVVYIYLVMSLKTEYYIMMSLSTIVMHST